MRRKVLHKRHKKQERPARLEVSINHAVKDTKVKWNLYHLYSRCTNELSKRMIIATQSIYHLTAITQEILLQRCQQSRPAYHTNEN